MALTRRQREVLDVIRDLLELRGYSPSLEEIGAELGLSSVATVHKHVTLLCDKGYLRRAWNQNRSIELVEFDKGASVRLPLSGTIAAGRPLEAIPTDESICVPADMVRDRSRSYVLRVQGVAKLCSLLQMPGWAPSVLHHAAAPRYNQHRESVNQPSGTLRDPQDCRFGVNAARKRGGIVVLAA